MARSSYYYQPKGESTENLALMRLIDEQYTRTPFYGSPKMTVWLKSQGHLVNEKRICRLMQRMGLAAVAPRRNLSKAAPEHRIYPYLLRDFAVERPDHVWSADITYIPLRTGFIYLMAILDWFSRYVLAWTVSVTLDIGFCLEALDWALAQAKPDIFNTDQGAQFTSPAFTGRLASEGIRISMDGRGRALDNVFVERLWRSVKYEEVYLHDYRSVPEATDCLATYFRFYNTERPHQMLGYRTPEAVYFGSAR